MCGRSAYTVAIQGNTDGTFPPISFSDIASKVPSRCGKWALVGAEIVSYRYDQTAGYSADRATVIYSVSKQGGLIGYISENYTELDEQPFERDLALSISPIMNDWFISGPNQATPWVMLRLERVE